MLFLKWLDLKNVWYKVVRYTTKNFSKYFCVVNSSSNKVIPDIIIHVVNALSLIETKMFDEYTFSECSCLFALIILYTNSNLTVSVSQQTSVIYISWSADYFFIIDNHQFTMNVNNFCDWDFVEYISFS